MTRYDDEHRGPGVENAYQLNTCLRFLWEADVAKDLHKDGRIKWIENHYLETRSRDQALSAITQLHREEAAEQALIQAILTGSLPVYTRPTDGVETYVAPEAFLELSKATLRAGCYRPHNDRGWLYGRPLFVKIADFSAWIRALVEADSSTAHEEAGSASQIEVAVSHDELEAFVAAYYANPANRRDWRRGAYEAFRQRYPHSTNKRDEVREAAEKLGFVASRASQRN